MKIWPKKPEPDAEGYYPVASTDEIIQDHVLERKIKGESLLLTRHNGEVLAFSSSCPHAAGNLADGHIYRGRIDCPEHAYRFDIRSGRTLWPPDEAYRLKLYPVKVVGRSVLVKLTGR